MDNHTLHCLACREGVKVCTNCRERKPLDDFHRKKAGHAGRAARCKECVRGELREAYWANVDDRRAAMRLYVKNNPAKFQEAKQRRRALLAGALVGEVDYDEIRAAFVDCYLCGHELSGDIHMDHVVPLSRGGAHSTDNLRPTHAGCNLRKNDRLLSELKWYPPVG